MAYLLKILFLLVFGIIVMLVYYSFEYHQESFYGSYTIYILPILIMYGAYKSYSMTFLKDKISFTPIMLFGIFLLHLMLLSVLFFIYSDFPGSNGVTLFFKIVGYMILPIFLIFVSLGFGKKILSRVKGWEEETKIFQFLSALGFGLSLFITGIVILALFGGFYIWSVALFLGGIIFFAYKEIYSFLLSTIQYKIEISQNISDGSQYRLVTSEFFFIIITFLISINLISATRPMPIGWDDMGVYMNYPQLIAQSGDLLSLGSMYAWQAFTAIGYLFQSPTQAFFLNNIGGILAVGVIVLSFMDLLKQKARTLINVPLMAGMMFISMPMIVFQQAKDMKIDPGLFFFSTCAVYMVLYLFLKYIGYKNVYHTSVGDIVQETTKESASLEIQIKPSITNSFLQYFSKYQHIGIADMFSQKKNLLYIALIGWLCGFAFTLKFTSLLLISSVLGVMFFAYLGVAGFIGYISLYVGIFTKAGLWGMMNVVYPKEDGTFRNTVFIIGSIIFLSTLGYGVKKYGYKALQRLCIVGGIFLVGVGISVSPWIGKNIIETKKIDIHSLLSGYTDTFRPDYTTFLTPEQKQNIDQISQYASMGSSGTTTNEDLGRYFGYEKGINNYLKLPYNLTMQTNQRGEFTDITFWYLCFIPVLFLFLGYKNRYINIGVFIGSIFVLGFFFLPFFSLFLQKIGLGFLVFFPQSLTAIFSGLELPGGYGVIAAFFFIPFLYILYGLERDKFGVLFKLNAVFAVFYIFLWAISAYGIVWYGIVMYYSLLLMIALGVSSLSQYDETAQSKHKVFRIIGTSIVMFFLMGYTFQSTLPSGMNNLTTASFQSFKAGHVDKYSAIFDAQRNYFNVLVELNLTSQGREELFDELIKNISHQRLQEIITHNNIGDVYMLHQLLVQLVSIELEAGNIEQHQIVSYAQTVRSQLYKEVLYPKVHRKNQSNIYRIGTFLRYFVVDNNKRMFEDSLVFSFDKYFYDENDIDLGIERMKKIGIDYFLVDLNAATIDRDPRRALTQRFENLLKTFTSEKIELVATDSVCLQTALERYNMSDKTLQDREDYIFFAGVNYESYDKEGKLTYNRNQKLISCYNTIFELIQEGSVNEASYAHLLPLQNHLIEKDPETIDELSQIFQENIKSGWMVLFKIKE